jgi:hypothetical protein
MSTRRKTMVATWEAPGRSGEIYAELEFDMTNAKKYIDDVSGAATVYATRAARQPKAHGNQRHASG